MTVSILASMAACVRSMEIGTMSTSPQSATRSFSKGWTLSTGFHGRMSDDCSRTARGPKRAPGRYDTPPSYGNAQQRHVEPGRALGGRQEHEGRELTEPRRDEGVARTGRHVGG